MFREIKEETYINLACKNIHCTETAKDEQFIFVRDGIDTQPNAICSNLEDEMKNPLPLQLELLPLLRDFMYFFDWWIHLENNFGRKCFKEDSPPPSKHW